VFTIIMSMQKERRYIIQGIIVFLIFIGLYTLLDQLNIGYSEMINQYGILFREGKGSFMSGFAVVFGMLTYGCTPCVIAFFSTVGITFAVAVLPLAGLPYKLLALLLLVLGFFWLKYETNHVKCKIKN